MKTIETRRDLEGRLLIRGKCSVCTKCWIYMGGAPKGKCIYGGPFEGYVSETNNNTKQNRDSKDSPAESS